MVMIIILREIQHDCSQKDQACFRSSDLSLQTEASVLIIKSDLKPSPFLPARHIEWISLCTAEASITVIPPQSVDTQTDEKSGEESGPFTVWGCVLLQRAEGMKLLASVAWAGDSSAFLQSEKNKRLSPPTIQGDNKLSSSKM